MEFFRVKTVDNVDILLNIDYIITAELMGATGSEHILQISMSNGRTVQISIESDLSSALLTRLSTSRGRR